jgi:hypothetical protein
VESRSCLLPHAVQSLPLAKDRQHRCAGLAHEKTL